MTNSAPTQACPRIRACSRPQVASSGHLLLAELVFEIRIGFPHSLGLAFAARPSVRRAYARVRSRTHTRGTYAGRGGRAAGVARGCVRGKASGERVTLICRLAREDTRDLPR